MTTSRFKDIVAGEFASSVGVIWLDITAAAIFAQQIPNHLRSRVAAAYQTANYGVRPLGAVIGATIGRRDALWIVGEQIHLESG